MWCLRHREVLLSGVLLSGVLLFEVLLFEVLLSMVLLSVVLLSVVLLFGVLLFRRSGFLKVTPVNQVTYTANERSACTKISFCAPSAKPVFWLYPGLL